MPMPKPTLKRTGAEQSGSLAGVMLGTGAVGGAPPSGVVRMTSSTAVVVAAV